MQIRMLIDAEESDLHACVVVDSLVQGRAMGGIRMTDLVTAGEVAELARRMTLKLALAGLDVGGAAGGITCGLPRGPERDRVLAEFGRAVAPLLHGGIYLGIDQGLNDRDRDLLFEAADFTPTEFLASHLPCSWQELRARCHDITGFGVCEAIDQAVNALSLREDRRNVTVQGYGNVGQAVADGLTDRGLHVVAVADREGTVSCPEGLPLQALKNATDAAGTIDRSLLPAGLLLDVRPDAWLDIDADVLVLAAGGNAVTEAEAPRVRAALVAEGGNCACTAEAQRLLAKRGVAVLPDIVVNVGGAASTALLLTGTVPKGDGAGAALDTDALVGWMYEEIGDWIRCNVSDLLEIAEESGVSLVDAAQELAEQRLRERTLRSTASSRV